VAGRVCACVWDGCWTGQVVRGACCWASLVYCLAALRGSMPRRAAGGGLGAGAWSAGRALAWVWGADVVADRGCVGAWGGCWTDRSCGVLAVVGTLAGAAGVGFGSGSGWRAEVVEGCGCAGVWDGCWTGQVVRGACCWASLVYCLAALRGSMPRSAAGGGLGAGAWSAGRALAWVWGADVVADRGCVGAWGGCWTDRSCGVLAVVRTLAGAAAGGFGSGAGLDGRAWVWGRGADVVAGRGFAGAWDGCWVGRAVPGIAGECAWAGVRWYGWARCPGVPQGVGLVRVPGLMGGLGLGAGGAMWRQAVGALVLGAVAGSAGQGWGAGRCASFGDCLAVRLGSMPRRATVVGLGAGASAAG
jgi:hypothetical protein